jgi:hypothetical protein
MPDTTTVLRNRMGAIKRSDGERCARHLELSTLHVTLWIMLPPSSSASGEELEPRGRAARSDRSISWRCNPAERVDRKDLAVEREQGFRERVCNNGEDFRQSDRVRVIEKSRKSKSAGRRRGTACVVRTSADLYLNSAIVVDSKHGCRHSR